MVERGDCELIWKSSRMAQDQRRGPVRTPCAGIHYALKRKPGLRRCTMHILRPYGVGARQVCECTAPLLSYLASVCTCEVREISGQGGDGSVAVEISPIWLWKRKRCAAFLMQRTHILGANEMGYYIKVES